MKKFEFSKSYEEIEVAGTIYKVSLKDEDRKKYGKQLAKFHDILVNAQGVDTKVLSLEDGLKLEDEVKVVTLETIDTILGEGIGKKLYEQSDDQIDELLPIIFGVAEIIQERREKKYSKYIKQPKVAKR